MNMESKNYNHHLHINTIVSYNILLLLSTRTMHTSNHVTACVGSGLILSQVPDCFKMIVFTSSIYGALVINVNLIVLLTQV